MIDPDFDPTKPWRDGLLAGSFILVASAYLLLGFVHLMTHHLERLFG